MGVPILTRRGDCFVSHAGESIASNLGLADWIAADDDDYVAKAVAFAEALRPDFKIYAKNVVENAKALAESLRAHGLDIVSGGTDNHLMLVDLRPKGLKGNVSEKALVRAAITCNKNGIPFDPETPFVTSGLRLGTPAATTRGFAVAEFKLVGGMIAEVLNAIAQSQDGKAPLVEAAIKERVKALTDRFPIYQ